MFAVARQVAHADLVLSDEETEVLEFINRYFEQTP